MKLWPWMLVGLGVLFLSGILAGVLRGRATRKAERAVHDALPQTLELSCPAFEHDAEMPVALSCEGEGGSPPLQWRSIHCCQVTSQPQAYPATSRASAPTP